MPGVKKQKPIGPEPDNPYVLDLQKAIMDFALDEGVTFLESAMALIEKRGLEPEFVGEMIRRCPQLMPEIKSEAAGLRLLRK